MDPVRLKSSIFALMNNFMVDIKDRCMSEEQMDGPCLAALGNSLAKTVLITAVFTDFHG